MALMTGKHPATEDRRDRMFHDYVDTDLIDLNNPPPAKTLGHTNRMPIPRLMLGNGPDNSVQPGFQGAGDCVFAFIFNLLRLAWAIGGKGLFPANGKQAIAAYSEVTGYILNDESTDNGTNMRTALNWFVNTGPMDANGVRHKAGAYAAINIKNWNHVLWALYLADSGVGIGIEFPDSAMTQFNQGKPWTVVPGSKLDGGHAILADLNYVVETWARPEETNEPFLQKYMDEAYIVFDQDGLIAGKSLEGFDSQQLLADVHAGA